MTAGEHRLALPAGYQLGKYRFQEVLGAGGFGITYLAEDSSLGRRVAIKELLPNDIATRLDGSTVVAKSKSEEDNLAWARDRFVKEGRALAACEHPNVVHVYEMIEANGTAYMVTKYEDGRSLSEWLKEVDGKPTEKELRSILAPLLAGLERVHKSGFLHRDLKPENIYITDDGRPLLLDFGSARQAVTDRTTSLTSIVTSGYAPFEQYHEDGKQGAWTDLYALAAVMYRAIHGKKPPEATRRLKDDPCLKLAREYSGKYSPQFLSAIDKALAVEGQKRPQSVAEWRPMLGEGPIDQSVIAVPWWKQRWDDVLAFARQKPGGAAGVGAAMVLLVALAIWKLASPGDGPRIATEGAATPVPAIAGTPAPMAATPAPSTPIPDLTLPPAPSTPLPFASTPVPVVEPPVVAPATPKPVPDSGPLVPEEGEDAVDRKMVAIWEFKPGNSTAPTLRWEQQSSGRYTVTQKGEVTETGMIVAKGGQLTRQVDGTSQRIAGTYRFKTTTQLVITGAQGDVTWRRIKALPVDPKPPIATADADKRDGQGTKPRANESPSRPKPRPQQPDIERKFKDIGNSIRRRLPF